MKIAIINGPNLNMLGTRETNIYGNQTFEMYLQNLQQKFSQINITYFQSNIEGEIVSQLQHEAANNTNAIILNAAAYTHTSVAIGDAIAAINIPVIEVHISNIYAREEFRQLNYISAKCKGTIIGLGLQGYELAVQYLLQNN